MDAVIATARNRGWPESHIHFEYFAGGDVSSADDKSFEVELRRSGKVIRVEPAQTVIEALASQGIEVPTGCQQGVCGTCLTRVLDGIPEHRDMYFTSEEHAANDQFLPCCSRAKTSRLVLDL
jgi:vanillate O-demethylase ferredoxin subunit